MSEEPASYKLALLRASALSIQIEAELTSRKSEALLVFLHDAKEQAAKALVALAEVDADDPAAIRKLQNEVRRFDDMVGWMKQRLLEGPEAERELNELQRQEARGLVLDPETAAKIGVQPEGMSDD
jgi:hypothetical protein